MVYNASIVCTTDRLVASMLISMEKDRINKNAFRENMAFHLMVNINHQMRRHVNPAEVKIHFTKKHNTWMLLHLSGRAGLRL